MQQSIHKFLEKSDLHGLPDTLVTLTPSYPLVTFQQKPCFRDILLKKGIVCPFLEIT